jgi:hypothetical protein
MLKPVIAVASFCVAVTAAINLASAQSIPAAADVEVYANSDAWLCRPARQDACAVDQDATIVAADGTLKREPFQADANAPIDCFYLYPTVSNEPGGNADRVVGPEEQLAVDQQFARFGAKCRLFAPMYRQVTLLGLTTAIIGNPIPIDRVLAYRDVVAAWNQYVAHDNQGRGVVLIGHSQGSTILTQLIKNEIDGKPIQAQMVSAILMGTNLPVPIGADIGGAFQHIPICRSSRQTGCVIAFADFRHDVPPPANSRFVQAPEGMQAVCANPASLSGGSGSLDAYLSASGLLVASKPAPPTAWTNPPQPIDAPFVKVPGLLSAECVTNGHGSYLAVTVHPTPGGARINAISGDVMFGGKVQEDWGLHLIDANLAMGNLIAIVGDQSEAYLAKSPNQDRNRSVRER